MAPTLLIPLLLTFSGELTQRTWDVDGVEREALIAVPDGDGSTQPVVFVFHGHGGNARQAARSFHLHDEWPEAIVVYPQGLPTPGRLTDPLGKRNGWQHAAEEQGDRDLKFFDAMLETLRKDYRISEKHVYSTGHSNGGGFTYLLWAERPDVLAAVAPSSAGVGPKGRTLTPKPAMHIAGKSDALVKFAWQEVTMRKIRELNGCETDGHRWTDDRGFEATRYASASGTQVVCVIHPGGHKFLSEGPQLIVRFFKEHMRSEAPAE